MEIQLIAGAVILFIFTFFVIKSIPRFSLFYIKLFYGEYSYKYVSLYKNYTKKSPHVYCFKDEIIFHIIPLLTNGKQKKIKTQKDIQFGDTKFFIKYSELIKAKGIPFCYNVFLLNSKELKVAGYKVSMFNSEIKALYFFYDNIFFMGEYVIKKEDKNINIAKFSETLIKKYCKEYLVDDENFEIDNNDGRIINFSDDGFFVSIKYFSHQNKEIVDNISSYYDDFQSVKGQTKTQFQQEIDDLL
ncbi:MAG: hypothetical protein JEY97_04665 [Bacteroidales bacterium]|nr:hypothetical protein [Bacteroidales bacterium]